MNTPDTKIIEQIASSCKIRLCTAEPVSGGDINIAWCLSDNNNNRYFLKLNDAHRFPAMFVKEAEGLEALRKYSSLLIPAVAAQGVTDNKQWLLLEWLEKGTALKTTMEGFGAALAAMHQQPQLYFGWPGDNYIGSLVQINTTHTNWHSFFTACRIMPMVKMLYDAGVYVKADITNAETFCKQLQHIFPEEPSSLLHGDLWGGNYLIAKNGRAAIFDPAVYYGHREMDLGMTKLFGGFNESFYAAYHAQYPLQPEWQQRLPVTQVYPLLVHAVLFGRHYVGSTKEIIKRYC